jgi:ketosteroid isomerase-like protein
MTAAVLWMVREPNSKDVKHGHGSSRNSSKTSRRVAVEATSAAENVKNGKSYRNQYHFLMELKNGKIHAVREYLDTMHANDVLCT